MKCVAIALLVGLVGAACSTPVDETTSASAAEQPSTTIAIGDEMVTTSSIEMAPSELAALPLAATPSQAEGPYYPVERLADQDHDLTAVDGLAAVPAGNVLIVNGTLLTSEGAPVAGGVVEIWQTDANGIYLHQDDPGVADRDPFFQGSGAATAAEDGSWSFRTIDPGYYEPRPRHIHVKVHVDGRPVLTTQIYFSDDPQAAGIDELLVATIRPGTDEDGAALLVADFRIVLPAA